MKITHITAYVDLNSGTCEVTKKEVKKNVLPLNRVGISYGKILTFEVSTDDVEKAMMEIDYKIHEVIKRIQNFQSRFF